MALEEYVRKRSFDRTPEPAPSTGKTSKPGATPEAPYFCVQRHNASRLHYDFRLEVDGVLKSWAVPKGPTLDPTVKHLAAHVEDHPLEYGGFEGNIPTGNYGAGSVMLWDRGTFELLGDKSAQDQLARGDFKFRLHGEKLRGEFALVLMKGRGKGNEWLLIKKHDDAAVPGWNVEDHAWSVLSGRTQEEIAQGLPAHQQKRGSAGAPDRVWKSSRPARNRRNAPAEATSPQTAPPEKALARKRAFRAADLPGAVKAPMPEALSPMLATLVTEPPQGDHWLFEIKWDGVRAICFLSGEKIRLVSRNGLATEKQYPELSVLPHYVAAKEAILDGEIAILDKKGVGRFELIQPRIMNSDPGSIAHMARSQPVTYYVFDVLYLDGYDLRKVPLIERKRALEAILTPTTVLRRSEHFPGVGEHLLESAREIGLEGIMAKRDTSLYEPGRSRDWMKIKVLSEQEFLICGYTTGERDYFSSLVLGFHENGRLMWAGNVGTGFDRKLLEKIWSRIEPLVTRRSPFDPVPKIPNVVWVRPEIACNVRFSNWTKDRRLRAPVFAGLRDDVSPATVVREQAVDPSEPQRLLTGNAEQAAIPVDGHTLKFTHLNKVFYPAEGYTKRDLLNYYDAVAPLILPHLRDRPLSLKRYPNGIQAKFFFQKDIPATYVSWLRRERIVAEENHRPVNFALADDRASLLYLVQMGCIDHNPWMSRVGHLEEPDFVLIDLDPQECPFERVIEAACLIREKLDELQLTGYPKTTGGDGLHIYVPIGPGYSYDHTRIFADILSRIVAQERPDLFTVPRSLAKREKGKVYFDYLQNGMGKTIAAPYVLRAYPGAPVATPLVWDEVRPGLTPGQFHLRNALDRFAQLGDLFQPVLHGKQNLESSLHKLEELLRRPAKPKAARS